MPWKDRFQRVKQEWDSMISPQGSQPHSEEPPPPPPAHTRPPPVDQAYWRPRFQPDVAVTDDWDAKIGNGPDGWGNQELQHYTAAPENAFQ